MSVHKFNQVNTKKGQITLSSSSVFILIWKCLNTRSAYYFGLVLHLQCQLLAKHCDSLLEPAAKLVGSGNAAQSKF